MKKVILYNLKRLLPYSLVVLIISAAIGVFGLLLGPQIMWSPDGRYVGTYYILFGVVTSDAFMPLVTLLTMPTCLFTAFMPLLIYGYRYKRQQADLFMAAPFSESVYRRIVLTIGCLLMLASFTVSYWISVGSYFLRFATAKLPEGYYFVTANFIYYLPAYVLMLLGVAATYFIAAFLLGLGQDATTAIITYSMTIAAFTLLPTAIAGYAEVAFYSTYYTDFFNKAMTLFKFDPFSWSSIVETWMLPMFRMVDAPNLFDVEHYQLAGYSLMLYYAGGAGCGVLCYLLKERSGEWAGATPMRNYYVRIPIYVTAASAGLLMSTASVIGAQYEILSIILTGAFGYLGLALYAHTFKLKFPDYLALIIFGGVTLLGFIVRLIANAALPNPYVASEEYASIQSIIQFL